MTKKFHVCDEKCEPAGTGIHNTDQAKKTKLPSGTKVKSVNDNAICELLRCYRFSGLYNTCDNIYGRPYLPYFD